MITAIGAVNEIIRIRRLALQIILKKKSWAILYVETGGRTSSFSLLQLVTWKVSALVDDKKVN